MAFFNDEPAAAEVERLLVKAESGAYELLMSVANWGEIYYSIMRATSQELAEHHAREIHGMRIKLVPAGEDLALVRQAAIFKASRRLGYADAFAAGFQRDPVWGLLIIQRNPRSLTGMLGDRLNESREYPPASAAKLSKGNSHTQERAAFVIARQSKN